jgi:hypothetical protein
VRRGLGVGGGRRLGLGRHAVQALAVDLAVVHVARPVREGLTGLRGDEPAVRLVRPDAIVALFEEVAPAGGVSDELITVSGVEIAHTTEIVAPKYRNQIATMSAVAQWSFLTNHARALLCIAHDPHLRLRDLATALGVTERSAYAIVADLTDAGYVLKERDGRRNRYSIQHDMPLPDSTERQRTVGEILHLLAGTPLRKRRVEAVD